MNHRTFLPLVVLTLIATSADCHAANDTRQESFTGVREIEGVSCISSAWFDAASGRFKGCTLAREITVGATRLPAGTMVEFDPEHRPRMLFLQHDSEIDGLVCRGSGHEFQTLLHPDGRLAFCNLAEPTKIDGVPCEKSSFWTWMLEGPAAVELHDSGKLKGCLLSKEFTFGGRKLAKGTRIELDAEGKLTAEQQRPN